MGIGNGYVFPGTIILSDPAFSTIRELALTIGSGLIYHKDISVNYGQIVSRLKRIEQNNKALNWYNEWGY